MTYFIKKNDTYRVTPEKALDIQTELPVGNYLVKFDSFADEHYLESMGEFTLPDKLYGNINDRTERIINTFESRDNSTGVLMTGEKGSGKSLLAKKICIELGKQGVSTIVVNGAWCGDGFNTFISSIEAPIVMLFDEFEKVYKKDEQQLLLTLFDGVFPGKRLFLLTANDKWSVDKHMTNRPGRLYYLLNYDGLDEAAIREYCEDRLNDKTQQKSILRLSAMSRNINFDMLQAIVEEMNRYGEGAKEVLELLNVDIEPGSENYDVTMQLKGYEYKPSAFKGDIFAESFDVYVQQRLLSENEDDYYYYEGKYEYFNPGHLTKVDEQHGIFVFVREDGLRAEFTRRKRSERFIASAWL